MENPNVYDDEGWATASSEISKAVGLFWDAGGTIVELENEIENALENSDAGKYLVSITEA